MESFDLQTVVQATGGRILPPGAQARLTSVSTDSRSLEQGALFVPLRGPRFDGHDYLLQAVQNGAAACLSEEMVAGLPVPVVQVGDTLKALGDLAAAFRKDFSGPVVAVTGSSGKTTTKEMLAAILDLTGPGLKTEGNFNNLVGLPLTLFRLAAGHRWAVLELGMSARGEIARLAEISGPTLGVITNVGPAHLETLYTLDGVARAKGELFAAISPGGTAVINADDERVLALPVANGVRRLLFGFSPTAEVRADEVRADGPRSSFRLLVAGSAWPVRLPVAGRHNVGNALAAAAAAVALGVATETIVQGLEAFQPCGGRTELVELANGVRLLKDTYNANPISVRAALATLDELGGAGRRIAVLGDMLELGPEAARLHREVGREAARRVDLLFLLGAMAAETAAGALAGGMTEEQVRIVADHGEAARLLRAAIRSGDRVLVKGSRGMKMENVIELLGGVGASAGSDHS